MTASTLDIARPIAHDTDGGIFSLLIALGRLLRRSLQQLSLVAIPPDADWRVVPADALRTLSIELSEAAQGHGSNVAGATVRFLRSTTHD